MLGAFISGTANLFKSIGIPIVFGEALIAVFIVSFANTTLDSAARIQRMSLQEIFQTPNGKVIRPFDNRYFATFVIVVAAALMSFIEPGGKGAMILWPLFGSLNQLLAALALGIVSVYLRIKKVNILFTLIPMLLILIVTLWAMVENLLRYLENNDILLAGLSTLILFLTAWLLISSTKALAGRGRSLVSDAETFIVSGR
jgi:carbon starvation protein